MWGWAHQLLMHKPPTRILQDHLFKKLTRIKPPLPPIMTLRHFQHCAIFGILVYFCIFVIFRIFHILHFSMPQIGLRVVRQNYLVACFACFVVSCFSVQWMLRRIFVVHCGTAKLPRGKMSDFVLCGCALLCIYMYTAMSWIQHPRWPRDFPRVEIYLEGRGKGFEVG